MDKLMRNSWVFV